MIQLSHHYRTFQSFLTPSRLISVDRPGEGGDAPTTALENVKREIEEDFTAFSGAFRQYDAELIHCVANIREKISRFRETAGSNERSLPEIAALVLEEVKTHLNIRKQRMAAVKVGKPHPAATALAYGDEPDHFIDLTVHEQSDLRWPPPAPATLHRDGGMKRICNEARHVMRNTMTGYTLTDEEIQALHDLGNDIGQPQEMEDLVIAQKIELLSYQIKVLVNVLREWFTHGVLSFEIPAINFHMNDPSTLTLRNYLEVNRTLDDAKILKNFSAALSNLRKRLNLLMTYCDEYRDQEFYDETIQALQPLRDKVLKLIEDYNHFLEDFEASERKVRGINTYNETL